MSNKSPPQIVTAMSHYGAYLGGGSNPFIVNFDPNESAYAVRNLALPTDLSLARLDDRRHLLQMLDRALWKNERAMDDMDDHLQGALNLLSSKSVRSAIDISAEAAQTRDAYGRHTFGQSALLARRLVESGVTFVTVNCVPWDHHGSANRMRTEDGARLLIPPLDRAIAALVRDLIDRGLYEKTLVVAMGEFGRTPRMNEYAGRDHWGETFSVLMGCGSMQMGHVVGRSSPRGERVVDRPLTPEDVAATVYHTWASTAKPSTSATVSTGHSRLSTRGSRFASWWGSARDQSRSERAIQPFSHSAIGTRCAFHK